MSVIDDFIDEGFNNYELELKKLKEENARLKHILADNMCWMDADPKGACRLSTEEMQESCKRFLNQLDGWPVLNVGQMTIAQLEKEVIEMQASFDLRYAADLRAIKRWQQATGKIRTWPDHADLCLWLMEQLEKNG